MNTKQENEANTLDKANEALTSTLPLLDTLHDPLYHIISYLNPQDIAVMKQSNKSYFNFFNNNEIWKKLAIHHFPHAVIENEKDADSKAHKIDYKKLYFQAQKNYEQFLLNRHGKDDNKLIIALFKCAKNNNLNFLKKFDLKNTYLLKGIGELVSIKDRYNTHVCCYAYKNKSQQFLDYIYDLMPKEDFHEETHLLVKIMFNKINSKEMENVLKQKNSQNYISRVLSIACSMGNEEISLVCLRALMDNKDYTTAIKSYSLTMAIREAVPSCSKHFIMILIKALRSVDPQAYMKTLTLLLPHVCSSGNEDNISLLIENGAEANNHNSKALLEACLNGHKRIIKLLTDRSRHIFWGFEELESLAKGTFSDIEILGLLFPLLSPVQTSQFLRILICRSLKVSSGNYLDQDKIKELIATKLSTAQIQSCLLDFMQQKNIGNLLPTLNILLVHPTLDFEFLSIEYLLNNKVNETFLNEITQIITNIDPRAFYLKDIENLIICFSFLCKALLPNNGATELMLKKAMMLDAQFYNKFMSQITKNNHTNVQYLLTVHEEMKINFAPERGQRA